MKWSTHSRRIDFDDPLPLAGDKLVCLRCRDRWLYTGITRAAKRLTIVV